MSVNNTDARGTLRGACSACGCGGYDGGSAGRRCTSCGHPPGRHQNLSMPPGQSTISAPSASFSISPKCQYPGCTNDVLYDMNTNQEYLYCQSHVGQPHPSPFQTLGSSRSTGSFSPFSSWFGSLFNSGQNQQPRQSFSQPTNKFPSASQAYPTPVVPPEQQCKLQGCIRARYQESDGTTYEFCGKRHALLFHQQQAKQSGNVPSDLQCKTPGCCRQRYPMPGNTGYYDYCSLTCRDSQHSSLASASMPNLSGSGTCSLPGCGRPKYVDPANGRVHDYCGRTHAYQAQKQGIVASPVSAAHGIRLANRQEQAAVHGKFQRTWAPRKGACPTVSQIFVISNQQLLVRWNQYQQTLNDQTVEEHYHGTIMTCNLTSNQTLCSDPNCGVCGISQMGFDRRCIRKNINFQRFGHGFYLAPNSSKCHDYTQGANGYRAMLLCDVCPGNKYNKTRDDQTLTGPPQGFDSVYGQTGHSLNYEEIVLYNPDAMLPRYIVVYQKDGIGKIAT